MARFQTTGASELLQPSISVRHSGLKCSVFLSLQCPRKETVCKKWDSQSHNHCALSYRGAPHWPCGSWLQLCFRFHFKDWLKKLKISRVCHVCRKRGVSTSGGSALLIRWLKVHAPALPGCHSWVLNPFCTRLLYYSSVLNVITNWDMWRKEFSLKVSFISSSAWS